VTLFYREGRSVRQVADLLGMREDAVKQRLARARQRLRESLLDEIGETLRATAPGAAFTVAVMAATVAAPSTAAAAGVGFGAKTAGAGVLAKIAGLFLGASAGFIFGLAGVIVGLRPLRKRARDAEERRQLARFQLVAVITVVIACSGFALFPLITGRGWPDVVTFVAFSAALYAEYFVWLPRIIARRLALERLEDPAAEARQRRDEIRRRLGYAVGVLSGGAALIAGLLLHGAHTLK